MFSFRRGYGGVKEEWDSVSKIVVIAHEGTPAAIFYSWRLF